MNMDKGINIVLKGCRRAIGMAYGILFWGFLGITLLLQPAFAGINIYQFDNAKEEQRFRGLIAELRCPKCQNQNLADSNAGLAKDLKDRTYQLVREGKTNKEIKSYLVDRYGDFIIYKPPFRLSTWLLWFGPLLVFLLVFGVFIRKHLQAPKKKPMEITLAEQQRLKNLIGNNEPGNSEASKHIDS